ncbi:hypothetical protein Vretimale_1971 [Volvox reticuliferus]|nr:hypothetical protein Vretimale_1971 [Volvox reticuliferus]
MVIGCGLPGFGRDGMVGSGGARQFYLADCGELQAPLPMQLNTWGPDSQLRNREGTEKAARGCYLPIRWSACKPPPPVLLSPVPQPRLCIAPPPSPFYPLPAPFPVS